MSCPQAHGLGSDRPHTLHDEIRRLIPTRAAPGVRAVIITSFGVEQSSRIAKNLVGATAAYAKEALTVRIILVTADGFQLATLDFDQHAAKRWMAIHWTLVRMSFVSPVVIAVSASGTAARVILSEMDSAATSGL